MNTLKSPPDLFFDATQRAFQFLESEYNCIGPDPTRLEQYGRDSLRNMLQHPHISVILESVRRYREGSMDVN